jgi:hypothetical protein
MYAPTLVEMNTCQFAIERKMSIKFWNKFKKMQAPAPSGGLELWWAGSTTRNLTRIVREIPTMIIITEDLNREASPFRLKRGALSGYFLRHKVTSCYTSYFLRHKVISYLP